MGIGAGVEVEVVKAAATFASTVASIAVSASRVPRIPASTVAGTSAVGRDSVCSAGVDGGSLEQATAVSPEITKTIRMIILIFFQFREDFQCFLFNRPYRQVQRFPALTEANSPGGGLARARQFPRPHPVPSLPSAGESQNEGLASAIPAAKRHASALGTGFRCRNPRGQRQLHPLLALLQGASDPQLRGLWLMRRFGRGSGPSCGGGSGNGPGRLVELAHRHTLPAVWQGVAHPLPAVPAQWPLTSSPSPVQDSVPRSRPR